MRKPHLLSTLLLAVPLVVGCKGDDKKGDPGKAPAAAKPAPAAATAANTPTAKTPPAAAPAKAAPATSTTLFNDDPAGVYNSSLGAISAAAVRDEALSIRLAGKEFTKCDVNLAHSTTATAVELAGALYVTCDSLDDPETEVQKFAIAGGSLKYVGTALVTGDPTPASLPLANFKDHRAAAAPADPVTTAKNWLSLVGKNSVDAAVHTQFPLTIRTTDKKPACAKTANPSSFDKARACLSKDLRPIGHSQWELRKDKVSELTALAKGIKSAHVVSFHSMGDGQTMDVDILIGDSGRVTAVLSNAEFFE